MNNLVQYIIIAVSSLGLIWYFICLFMLGSKPTTPGQAADMFGIFQSLSLTTISSTLATFIGMLLGLNTVSGNITQQAVTAAAPDKTAGMINAALSSSLQWWAAVLYVLSIVIALYFLFKHRDKTDSAVANLGKSLLGLIIGVMAIALNLPTPPPPPSTACAKSAPEFFATAQIKPSHLQ